MNDEKNILKKIAESTKERVENEKKKTALTKVRDEAERFKKTGFPFEAALKKERLSFICEVKRASPSAGIISEDFDFCKIAKAYEDAGAEAISVLTEPFYFGGGGEYLHEISRCTSVPLLRKDFTVDDYMIYEAVTLGASAVLLICAILDDERLREYAALAHSLGLSALVETRDEYEIERALKADARIIGVNNRNLKTFEVDVRHSAKLKPLIPRDKIFVSESGIRTRADVEELERIGTNAVLIGETLMKSNDIKTALSRLRGECDR